MTQVYGVQKNFVLACPSNLLAYPEGTTYTTHAIVNNDSFLARVGTFERCGAFLSISALVPDIDGSFMLVGEFGETLYEEPMNTQSYLPIQKSRRYIRTRKHCTAYRSK